MDKDTKDIVKEKVVKLIDDAIKIDKKTVKYIQLSHDDLRALEQSVAKEVSANGKVTQIHESVGYEFRLGPETKILEDK